MSAFRGRADLEESKPRLPVLTLRRLRSHDRFPLRPNGSPPNFGLASPAILPQSFADRAANARLLVRCRPDRALGSSACDLSDQLRANRLLEILAVLDRQHKGARAADNAVLVVPIEVIDIHGRIGWL